MSSPEQVATTPPPVGNDNPAAPQAAVRTAGMAGAGPSPEQLPRLLPDSAVFVNEFTRPLPDPAVTFSGPGYFSPAPRTSGFATAALLASLVGVVAGFVAPLAVIFGHLGVHHTRSNERTGRGMAMGGMILGYAVTLFWTVLITTVWLTSP
ncbi:MAG TPA: DUF4190 domain-containing protein [Beutenbergiaceae bacterium]|nr:DUF4190 domain-containing protein [Beutenbergiaceae bacterium]